MHAGPLQHSLALCQVVQSKSFAIGPERFETVGAYLGKQIEGAQIPVATEQLVSVEGRQCVQVFGGGQGRGGVVQGGDERQCRRDSLAQQSAQDVVLGLEVVIQRGLSDADRVGNGSRGRAGVTQRGEQFACRIEYFVSCGDARTTLRVQPWSSGAGDRHPFIVVHRGADRYRRPYLSCDRNMRYAAVTHASELLTSCLPVRYQAGSSKGKTVN